MATTMKCSVVLVHPWMMALLTRLAEGQGRFVAVISHLLSYLPYLVCTSTVNTRTATTTTTITVFLAPLSSYL